MFLSPRFALAMLLLGVVASPAVAQDDRSAAVQDPPAQAALATDEGPARYASLAEAVAAQQLLPTLNRQADAHTHTQFCGSYARYGFHEDALWSAHAVCSQLLGRDAFDAAPDAAAELALR